MTCTSCETPTAEGMHLCIDCVLKLEAILDAAPEMLAEARTTIERMDRLSDRGAAARGGGTPPEVLNLECSARADELEKLLLSWALCLLDEADERGVTVGRYGTEYARLLREHTALVRMADWAGDCLDELKRAHRRLVQAVDSPPEYIIVGSCTAELEAGTECGTRLRALKGAEQVQCGACGSWFVVQEFLDWTRERVRGTPMRRTEVCRFLAQQARVRVSVKDLDNWVMLGHLRYVLEAVPSEGRPVRAYFPGDVLGLHHRMSDRRRAA